MTPSSLWPAAFAFASFGLAELGSGLGLNDDLTKMLMQGGALVLVSWLVIQTFKVTLPQLTETFQAESRHQRDTFENTLKEIEVGFVKQINEMFIAEIRQQRLEFREELSKQRHAFCNIINAMNLERHHLKQEMIDLGDQPVQDTHTLKP